MRPRHVIIGGGTAGLNAIRTIREHDPGASEIVLVAAERPYARMVLPYYLARGIAESRVYTADARRLADLGVQPQLGHRATRLDPARRQVTLDDDRVLEYTTLLIATGSSAARPPIPGAGLPAVHAFWTLKHAREVTATLREGSRVAVVGGGFIAFTMLNALLQRGAQVTLLEAASRVLPRMVDEGAAALVEARLRGRGVEVRTGIQLTAIAEAGAGARLHLQGGGPLTAEVVVMATGIRPNLEWLADSGIRIDRGIVVDDHQRSSVPAVYAAGDVAEGRDRVTGEAALHALEPTAMEQGRVAGANMAGGDVAYRGSLSMNIVDACGLEVVSIGAWDDAGASASARADHDREAYRKLLWRDDRLVGAILVGRTEDVWTTNDAGMLKGLVQGGRPLGPWKPILDRSPFEVKRAFVAAGRTGDLLPETLLGRPSASPR